METFAISELRKIVIISFKDQGQRSVQDEKNFKCFAKFHWKFQNVQLFYFFFCFFFDLLNFWLCLWPKLSDFHFAIFTFNLSRKKGFIIFHTPNTWNNKIVKNIQSRSYDGILHCSTHDNENQNHFQSFSRATEEGQNKLQLKI